MTIGSAEVIHAFAKSATRSNCRWAFGTGAESAD
jgi:hypothetical protein